MPSIPNSFCEELRRAGSIGAIDTHAKTEVDVSQEKRHYRAVTRERII